MFFDYKEFLRIILNYRVEYEHEENFRLFICICKIGPNETVELMFNFEKKIGKKFAINVWLSKNFYRTLFPTIIGVLFHHLIKKKLLVLDFCLIL